MSKISAPIVNCAWRTSQNCQVLSHWSTTNWKISNHERQLPSMLQYCHGQQGQFRYFLLIVDMFSKYVEAVAMKDQHAESIKVALNNGWIHRHGNFSIAVSDQAKNIDGRVINELCKDIGAEKRRSSPYHPEGNGQAERCIATMKGLARRIVAERGMEKHDWPGILQEACFMMNVTINSSIGVTPFEAMYGDNAVLPSPIITPRIGTDDAIEASDRIEEAKNQTSEVWKKVQTNLDDSKESRNRKRNADRSSSKTQVGDFVFVRKFVRKDSLDPMYIGPYEVVKRTNVQIRHPSRGLITIHLNNCKSPPPTDTIVLPGPDNSESGDAEPHVDVPEITKTADISSSRRENEMPSLNDSDLDVPIALRRVPRNKQKELSEDFVSS